jgi:hypothetical protein
VHDELARRAGGFSIAVTVRAYDLRDTGNANVHAVITSASLENISLTDTPANVHALVMNRYPVPAATKFYDIMQTKVSRLTELLTLMKRMHNEHPRKSDTRPSPSVPVRGSGAGRWDEFGNAPAFLLRQLHSDRSTDQTAGPSSASGDCQ